MAEDGYALRVRNGQMEVLYNRADIVGENMRGGADDGKNG